MAQSIAKNTMFMTVASVFQKVISFVYFLVVARFIGAESLGTYHVALTTTTLFVVFVDLGFTNVLIREAAKHRDKIQQYVSSVVFIKVLLGILSYGGVVVFASLMGYEQELRNLVYLSGITMLLDSFHLTVYGTLRTLEDLRYEAAGMVGSQLLTLVLGSVFLYLGLPLIFLIAAFTIPSAMNAFYACVVLYKKGYTCWPTHKKKIMVSMGKIAIPFALAGVFARVYGNVDTLIIKQMLGDRAAGWYAAPFKIAYAFQFIPFAFIAALYPKFSEYFVTHKEKLSRMFEQSVVYLLIIAAPIATGISLLAEDIMFLAFTSEFAPSVLPLKIIMIGVVFGFLSFPIGALLNACNKQVTQTVIVGGAMCVSVVLNVMFIPLFGISGAAMAVVATQIFLVVFGYFVVPKIASVRHGYLAGMVTKIGLACAVMGFFVMFTTTYTHFIFAILVGVVVYPVMLFVTRTLSKEQVGELKNLLRGR